MRVYDVTVIRFDRPADFISTIFRLSFIRLLSTILAVGANLVQLGASVDVSERIKQSHKHTGARASDANDNKTRV